MRFTIFALSIAWTAGSNEAGSAFLKSNGEQDGVTTLPSGLQYRVIKSATNESAPRPGPSEPCVCHYHGTLVDGTVFDSSRTRGSPATFAPNQVIKGWTQALQLMQEGDRWQLVLPSELAYGNRGAGKKIPPGAVLIFDLELISVGGGVGGLSGFLSKPVGPLKMWQLVACAVLLMLGWAYTKFNGGGGKKVSASHILVKDEALCEKLLVDIMAAADNAAAFANAAKEHSTCPSGKSGGSLGTFGPGQMVPAFDKVCWSAPVGKVMGPVQTNFGFHLIIVTERTSPDDEGAPAKSKDA